MGSPSISAIIPSYNYGHFVTEAVDSCLGQNYDGAIEVIVVDDGSKDDTRQRIAAYGDKVRYVYQDNRGLSGARNTGIREAKSEWVAFLDADDVWHKDKSALMMRIALEHGFDVIGSPGKHYMADVLDPNPPVKTFDVLDFLVESPYSSSTTILKRACFAKAGNFDETLRSVEDRDMWLRLAAHYKCGAIDSALALHRAHTGQMSRNAARMLSNFERCLEKFFREHPQFEHHKRIAYAFMYVDAAVAFMEGGDRKEAIKYMLKSLRYHPIDDGRSRRNLGSVRRLKLLARTLLGEKFFTKVRGEPVREDTMRTTWENEKRP
jgi:glycosyltransferase involved in cell wall biosynthesis